ncbi:MULTISPECIES: hypothetical protein [Kribbella]|uniref:hypothetical protein n=1 Tax=Kribbella TaxID=182639 RepID=UPI001052C10F|nr:MULTISPECIES: hypothetical protein [Kribbella]
MPIHQGPPQRSTVLAAVLAALIAVALGILAAKTIPTAAEHRGQIQAAGYHVATCTIQAERHDDSRIQTLAHLANCLQDNHQIRTEAGDITLTIFSLAVLGWAVGSSSTAGTTNRSAGRDPGALFGGRHAQRVRHHL